MLNRVPVAEFGPFRRGRIAMPNKKIFLRRFLSLGRGQFQSQPHEHQAGHPVHDDLGFVGTGEETAKRSRQQGDAAEYKDGGDDEHTSQQDHLQGQGTTGRIGELRQEGQEEDRHFGIGDIHDNSPAVEFAEAQTNP